jgi:hypothetical protein
MKLRTAFTLAVAAFAIGVPNAVADPGGYEPPVGAQPDALDRYVNNNAPEEQPDAIGRYLSNHAGHPDSRADRPSLAVAVEAAAADGRGWTTAALGALGGAFFVLLAVVGASAIRERRRLVLR